MKTLKEFVEKENERIENEKQEERAESGYAPFFKINEGESILEFMDVEPRNNDKYDNRIIFRVMSNSIEYDLSVNTKSPLYNDIIKYLNNGATKLRILRVGTSREDTRYSVKPF